MADNFNMKQFLVENKLGAYSRIKENKTAEDLFQMFKDEDLVNDRREYDEEDLMSTYPGLSKKEAEKLVNMLQNIDETKEKEEKAKLTKEGGDEDKLPLTPKMKKFIDKVISDAKKDGEFEELVQVDYFENDLIDFILEKFDDESNYDDVSQEVKDYINKSVKDYYRNPDGTPYFSEDLGQDRTDAEAEKMMDFLYEKEKTEEGYMGTQYNSSEDMAVDMLKKGITEKEKVEEGQGDLMAIERIEEIVNNLARNISTNSNIPTQEKLGLVQALKELKDLVEDLGTSVEMGMDETKKPMKEGEDIFADIEGDLGETLSKRDAIEYLKEVIDFCEKKIVDFENEQGYEEEDDLDEAMGGKNPEGDALVLRFLQGVAKKFNYPVSQAAVFVKNTIKSLGY